MAELDEANWEQVYQLIKQEIDYRYEYRKRGRPFPTPLENVAELIEILDRIEPYARQKAVAEITEQTKLAMDRVAGKPVPEPKPLGMFEKLEQLKKKSYQQRGSLLPLTPTEELLYDLDMLRRRIRADAKDQEQTIDNLKNRKWCGIDCPYPDACISKDLHHGTYSTYGCLLYRLTWRIDIPWWKAVFQFRPHLTDIQEKALERIRNSYYSADHEETLTYLCFRYPK